MFTRTGMTSHNTGIGRAPGFKIKIMKGMGLISFLLISCIILSSINLRTASAADPCDCASCHGVNHHGDWSACTTCHITLGFGGQADAHTTHGAALSNTTYGDAITSSAGQYAYGCGNCHSLSVSTVATHTAARTPNMELYNPNAVKRGQGPDQNCSDCHGSSGPHGAKCNSNGNSSDCLSCHSIKQGSTLPIIAAQNHHSGACATCHYAGAPDGREPHDNIMPLATNDSCLVCHTLGGTNGPAAYTHVSGAATPATCTKCHTNPAGTHAGVKPTAAQACIQCHTAGGTAPDLGIVVLSNAAMNIHGNNPLAGTATANFTAKADPAVSRKVAFDATGSSCNATCTSYSWDFGDSSTGTGATPTHTFAAAGTYSVTLTVYDATTGAAGTTGFVNAVAIDAPPVVTSFTCTGTGATSQTATYSATDDIGLKSITVDWGDGSAKLTTTLSGTSAGPTTTSAHKYQKSGTFTMTATVGDTASHTTAATCSAGTVSISTSTTGASVIGGHVYKSNGTTAVATAYVTLTSNKGVMRMQYTTSLGAYSFGSLPAGTYTVTVTKYGYTFATAPQLTGISVDGTSISTGNNINAVTP